MHGSNMGNAIRMKLGHNQSHETLKHKMKGSHAKQVLAWQGTNEYVSARMQDTWG